MSRWLQNNSERDLDIIDPEARQGQHSRRKQQIMWNDTLKSKRGGPAQFLDPDWPARPGAVLEDADEQKDRWLMSAVWKLIRAGRTENESDNRPGIKQWCEQYGQPWRAASLLGGTIFGTTGKVGEPGGNTCRNLWKNMCWEISQSTNCEEEAAVYAALAGNKFRLENSGEYFQLDESLVSSSHASALQVMGRPVLATVLSCGRTVQGRSDRRIPPAAA